MRQRLIDRWERFERRTPEKLLLAYALIFGLALGFIVSEWDHGGGPKPGSTWVVHN